MARPDLIIVDPTILGGKPILAGTRIAIALVLDLLAAGASEAEILESYPGLTADHVRACVAYEAT